jgi:hypothetical protein
MAAEDDLKKVLALVPGGQSLQVKLDNLKAYIKAQAQAGAEQAIPTITVAVEKASAGVIQPYVIGGLAIASAALLLSFSTYLKARQ